MPRFAPTSERTAGHGPAASVTVGMRSVRLRRLQGCGAAIATIPSGERATKDQGPGHRRDDQALFRAYMG
jgi:hypothetical protein